MFGLFRLEATALESTFQGFPSHLPEDSERQQKIDELKALLEDIRSPYPTRSELLGVMNEAADGALSHDSVRVITRILGRCPTLTN
jgi:hypothetical protein